MRVLTFTSLYPNTADPRLGIFVRNRMVHFDELLGVTRKVIAPVQYAPLLGLKKGSRFHRYNQVPRQEEMDGIPVFHPRYMTLPGTNLIDVAWAMYKAGQKSLLQAYPEGEDFDLVDGHYLYPDGVAASHLARRHKKPLVLTARGSDVNFWMEQEKPRAAVLDAIEYARTVICVSQALKDRLITHGVPADKIVVLMNGVDQAFFAAAEQDTQQQNHLLSVGNLVPLKGHNHILDAVARMPHCYLTLIGSGDQEQTLRDQAERLKVSSRVTFLSHVSHSDLPGHYARAQCTILMSAMEGMPNVVLESLATGTPVVATAVGGIPEVITPENGILLAERSGEALQESLQEVLSRPWDRRGISRKVSHLDWRKTARDLEHIFTQALNTSR